MDQSARFAQQPAAKFNFKRELPVSESPPDEALAAAEVKVPRYSGLVPPLCSWKEPSLIKYVAPSTYIRVLLLLQATGRTAAALEYTCLGGKRTSKSQSELLDCFATCVSQG